MLTSFFSIYDNKNKTYTLPFCAPNLEVASRSVALAMCGDEALKFFADDYTLIRVGSFDPNTGDVFSIKETPLSMECTPEGVCSCSLKDILDKYPFVMELNDVPKEPAL